MNDTDTTIEQTDAELEAVRLRWPVEWRAAPGNLDVRYKDRLIELLAVPYDQTTIVEYPRGTNRLIEETMDPGAFLDDIATSIRPSRVKGVRDHDHTKLFGKAINVNAKRDDGLEVALRVAHTPLGDETLDLAAEGVLEPSVGFASAPSDVRWDAGRRARRVMRALLDHVALVGNAAYPGAQVLAVRDAGPPAAPAESVPTPYLEELWAWQREHGLR